MKTEAPLYTKEAKKISKMVSLPIDIFTSEWNKDLIQQVIVSLQNCAFLPHQQNLFLLIYQTH